MVTSSIVGALGLEENNSPPAAGSGGNDGGLGELLTDIFLIFAFFGPTRDAKF